jgi:cytochrome d ubiquinol oxidase subunit II
MNSVAPVWDGNETWLILGGGGLFAVFPLAYAVVMPALYMPITLMLLGLVFRGVAFEFRWKTRRWKPVWDVAFFGGSLVAALCQGIALGALVQGIEVVDRAYAGGWWDWLTPFSVLTGVAVATGYALLGATWLVMKTEGRLQHRMRRLAWPLGAVTLAAMGLVSILTPFLDPVYFTRWFNLPGSLLSVVMPLLVLIAAWALFTGLSDGRDGRPFLAALSLFVLGFIGIGVSFYPMMVPPSLTIWQVAAPDKSLAFALVGAVVLLPLILAYTAYAYWVFRGKVRVGEGYH